ncbi:MAG: hypothetical protein AAFN09_13340 [Pseudomonadota bacterium]
MLRVLAIFALTAALALAGCRDEAPGFIDTSTILVEHDVVSTVRGLQWIGDNIIIFGGEPNDRQGRYAYTLNRAGELQEFAPASGARVCYNSRVTTGLAFFNPRNREQSLYFVAREGEAGEVEFLPMQEEDEVCFLGGQPTEYVDPILIYTSWSPARPFDHIIEADRDQQTQISYLEYPDGSRVRVPFSEHSERLRTVPLTVNLRDVNGGNWQMLSPILDLLGLRYHFENDVPIEVALIKSPDDIEIISLYVPDENLRVRRFFYTPAGIGSAIDNRIARSFGEDTAGIYIFDETGPVRVFAGHVFEVATNAANECEIVFSTPRPRSHVLESYQIRIMNVCEFLEQQGD